MPVDPARPLMPPPPLDRTEAATQRAALTLLEEHRAELRPQGYALAWEQLACGLRDPGARRNRPPPHRRR